MENVEVELDDTRSPEAQAIIDAELGVEPEVNEEEEDVSLPSDEGEDNAEPELYAGKYKSQDELIDGIKNIGSNLPEYVLSGMSAESLEEHYKEIRKEFSSKPSGNRKHTSEVEKEEVPDVAPASDEIPSNIGEELWSELESSFKSSGKIDGAQYDKLNEAGYPDSVIDKYLDGVKSEQNNFTQKVYEVAGGEEEYNVMKAWADENLSESEINTISSMTNYEQMLLALEGVKARYNAANGGVNSRNTIRGNKTTTSSGKGYASAGDYQADVNDPRYRTDERFRNKVKSKLSRSNLTE